jgi:4-hydroxybenzoate polyprenyltransferase
MNDCYSAVPAPAQTPAQTLRAFVEALRPRQWLKNGIIFAGLIFSQNLFDATQVLLAVGGFVLFCALSSSVYMINDLGDLERDRVHPTKRLRPLASGRLPLAAVYVAAPILAAAGLALSFVLRLEFGLLALGYFALNLAYTYWLKHIAIVDVMSIAIGFVIRAIAGAEVIAVIISPWLLICTIFLALFIALAKRRHELLVLEAGAGDHRVSLAHYSPYLLDQMIAVVTASTVISYVLYTVWPDTVAKFGTHDLVYTSPFVIFGVFRYLYLVHQRAEGGAPERIPLSDTPMLINLALWAASVVVVLYWAAVRG